MDEEFKQRRQPSRPDFLRPLVRVLASPNSGTAKGRTPNYFFAVVRPSTSHLLRSTFRYDPRARRRTSERVGITPIVLLSSMRFLSMSFSTCSLTRTFSWDRDGFGSIRQL